MVLNLIAVCKCYDGSGNKEVWWFECRPNRHNLSCFYAFYAILKRRLLVPSYNHNVESSQSFNLVSWSYSRHVPMLTQGSTLVLLKC
jgi:hypothetical protein